LEGLVELRSLWPSGPREPQIEVEKRTFWMQSKDLLS